MTESPTNASPSNDDSNRDLVTVGDRIRQARERAGLNRVQLAELAGMTKSQVFRIESEDTNLVVRTVIRLAEVLKVDVGSLLPGSHLTESAGLGGARLAVLESAVGELQTVIQDAATSIEKLGAFLARLEHLIEAGRSSDAGDTHPSKAKKLMPDK